MRLIDQGVLLTGANQGSGLRLAHELIHYDVDLILVDRGSDNIEPLLQAPGRARSVRYVNMDLQQPQSIEHGLQELGDDLKPIAILINNAGHSTEGLLEHQAVRDIYRLFHVNLLAAIHLTHHLLPHLLQQDEAMIVNHASVNGILRAPGSTTYSASKAGLVGFGQALRRELAETRVRVLTLLTPAVDTRMFRQPSVSFQPMPATTDYRLSLSGCRWCMAHATCSSSACSSA